MWAAVELRADREIVLAAVKQNGLALEHAAAELQANHEIVLAAMLQNTEAHQYASEEIRKSDRPIQLFAEQHSGESRVRCIGLSGLELTVVPFELDAAAEVLFPRIKEELPPGLGRIYFVLPDRTILQPPGLGPLVLKLPNGTFGLRALRSPLSVHELFGLRVIR